MNSEEVPVLEYSVEVDLGALPPGGKFFKLAVDHGISPMLAKRLGVVSVRNCAGEIHLKANKTVITAAGNVRAFLVRECVLSLEELDELIDDSFEVEFLRHDIAPKAGGQSDELNLREVHGEEVFDVGELLIQQLSLAMEPFPRKEGVNSLVEEFGTEPEVSPFAVLQQDFNKQKT